MWHELSLGVYMKLPHPSLGLHAEIQAWRPVTLMTVKAPLGGANPRMLQLSLPGSGAQVGVGGLGCEVRVTVTNVDGTGDEVMVISREAERVKVAWVVAIDVVGALSSSSAVVTVGTVS
jgi:hypothetical protein